MSAVGFVVTSFIHATYMKRISVSMAQLLLSVLLIVMFVYVHERVYVKVLQLTIIFLINHLVCTVSQTPN